MYCRCSIFWGALNIGAMGFSSGKIYLIAMMFYAGFLFSPWVSAIVLYLSVTTLAVFANLAINGITAAEGIMNTLASSVEVWVDNAVDFLVVAIPLLIMQIIIVRSIVTLLEKLRSEVSGKETLLEEILKIEQ